MKIDEQFKCKDCDNYNLCKYYHNRRETSFICKEFQNQWEFIKKLEKINTEIKELAFLFDDLSPDKELVVDLDNIEEVIDKHINELKGE